MTFWLPTLYDRGPLHPTNCIVKRTPDFFIKMYLKKSSVYPFNILASKHNKYNKIYYNNYILYIIFLYYYNQTKIVLIQTTTNLKFLINHLILPWYSTESYKVFSIFVSNFCSFFTVIITSNISRNINHTLISLVSPP